MIKKVVLSISLVVALMVAVPKAIHVHAQQAQASFGLTVASSVTACSTVAQNTICLAGSSTAPVLAISVNGGTFQLVQGSQGPVGPAGPQGTPGAVGAAGPAGAPGVPAVGQAYSQKCTVFSLSGSATNGSSAMAGCTATIP